MFGYKNKNNNRKNTRSNLHTRMMNFTPFLVDTRYLGHLHKEMKLRNARKGMLTLRKKLKATNEQTIKMKWADYRVKYIDQEWHTQPENV